MAVQSQSNGSSRSPTDTPPSRRPLGCGPSPARAPSTRAGRWRGRACFCVNGEETSEKGSAFFSPGKADPPPPSLNQTSLSSFTSLPPPAPSRTGRPCPRRQPRQPWLVVAGVRRPPFCSVAAGARPRRRRGDRGRWWCWAVGVAGGGQRPALLSSSLFCVSGWQKGRPSRPGRRWGVAKAVGRRAQKGWRRVGWQARRRWRRRYSHSPHPPRDAFFSPSTVEMG